MVVIGASDTDTEILQKLSRIEETLAHGLSRVEQQLGNGKETFEFFRDGLQAYRDRSLSQSATANLHGKWLAKISQDKELRFPHRKILEVLLNQYDFEKGQHIELHFSKLVQEARLGKNKAQSYLSLLLQKHYIAVRNDGYRLFYKLNDLENE